MPHDEGLAQRIREALTDRPGISEKKMFGGVAFLCHGHMFVGIAAQSLMVRVGPDGYERALAMPHARVMDFTGKPMRGYVFVDAQGFATASDLAAWIDRSLCFVRSLRPK